MKRRTMPMFCVVLIALGTSEVQAQINYPVDFRAGAFTGNSKRHLAVNDAVGDELTSSVKGFEATLSPAKGSGGIGGRILEGTFGGQKYSLKEGKLFVGETWFRAEAGYGQISVPGLDSTVAFTRAGARSVVRIGGSGVSLSASAAKYFKGDFSNKNENTANKTSGWEGETAIFYTAPVVPAYVQLGYRTAYFSFGPMEEHLNGIVFGIGIWLGGR